MSITQLAGKWSIWGVVDEKAEVENCIFLKSLLGTTMQDGGIRERKIGQTLPFTVNSYRNLAKNKNVI